MLKGLGLVWCNVIYCLVFSCDIDENCLYLIYELLLF